MTAILTSPKLLPTVMIILSLGASVIWMWNGDWRRATYWLAAAVLTYQGGAVRGIDHAPTAVRAGEAIRLDRLHLGPLKQIVRKGDGCSHA